MSPARPPSPRRRDVLVGLAGLAACAKQPAVTAWTSPPSRVRLGWRWAPGQPWAWRTTVTRTDPAWTTSTTEAWRYTATSLDPAGVIHVVGELTGVGARGAGPGGASLPPELAAAWKQPASPAVSLTMRLSGRLLTCSADGFDAALPHRLLAVHFPAHEVAVGDGWPDGGLLDAFASALPRADDADATTTLAALDPDGHARFDHIARLRPAAHGPGVTITGRSRWHLADGRLVDRTLTARIDGDASALQVDVVPEADA